MAGIKDIAKLAGVSIGSVDRVLHNRGRCSEQTRQKVESAIKSLNYQPNLVARQLKRGHGCRIAVIQPFPHQDQGYWSHAEEAVTEAIKLHQSFGVEIESFYFDRHSSSSLDEVYNKVSAQEFHGVLMPPLLPDESRAFIAAHPEMSTVLMDCSLENVSVLQSIFQDGATSGATAADLFTFKHDPEDSLAMIGFESPHPYIEARLNGFEATLKKHGFKAPVRYMIPDDLGIMDLQNFLRENSIDLGQHQGVYVAKTGVYKYARILNAKEHRITVVGYDLTPDNIRELKFGTIDFLISQDCRRQVEIGIQTLVDQQLYGKKPAMPLVSMPVDIISRNNFQPSGIGRQGPV
jgi:LacI family transcriptional regulator